MTVLLWILAFLGIVIIYSGSSIVKLITKTDVHTKTVTLIKLVGVLLSAASMAMLWTNGLLK